MLPTEVVKDCICFAKNYEEAQKSVDGEYDISLSTTTSTISSLGLGGDTTSSATSYTPDAYAISEVEATSYYAGLHSKPRLLYHIGKEWTPSNK